jgi:hypothetical protein
LGWREQNRSKRSLFKKAPQKFLCVFGRGTFEHPVKRLKSLLRSFSSEKRPLPQGSAARGSVTMAVDAGRINKASGMTAKVSTISNL